MQTEMPAALLEATGEDDEAVDAVATLPGTEIAEE